VSVLAQNPPWFWESAIRSESAKGIQIIDDSFDKILWKRGLGFYREGRKE
jgi:hypothetical protein